MIKINLLILIICLSSVAYSADAGDWVDTFDLPIGFYVPPFYAGYLDVDF